MSAENDVTYGLVKQYPKPFLKLCYVTDKNYEQFFITVESW